MTTGELAKRVAALEAAVAELASKIEEAGKTRRWWRDSAGMFANDPVFDEIDRLGREYRESLRPGAKKKAKRPKAKAKVTSARA